jgi:hypothetical protein
MAVKILNHRNLVWTQYQAISRANRDKDYPIKLLKLYESLDPAYDSYFVTALKTEYQTHRDKALEDARLALRHADNLWTDYQKNGRITGLQRLEATISRQYREQAKRLSDAMSQSSHGMAIYHLVRIQPSEEQQSTYHAILQETRLQRRSMQELKMVLESRLFEGKIALLPEAK